MHGMRVVEGDVMIPGSSVVVELIGTFCFASILVGAGIHLRLMISG